MNVEELKKYRDCKTHEHCILSVERCLTCNYGNMVKVPLKIVLQMVANDETVRK